MIVPDDKSPAVLTRLQTIIMFLFIVLAFAAVAYRTEVVLSEIKDAAIEHENTAKELVDCNTLGGECYKQSQTDVQSLKTSLAESRKRIIVSALVCNNRPGGQNVKMLTTCITDLMKEPR